MGNFTGFEKFEDYYIHPRLGHIRRIQNQDGPQLIQYRVLVETQDAIESWSSIINSLSNASLDLIIYLPISHFYHKIGYCGGFCQLFLLFDDYMFCLKDEIKNRRGIKRNFSESSIWQILYKLVKASRLMEKFKIKIGNVKPQNILVNQQGDLRVISEYSLPKSQSHINSLTIQQNFYSPEELLQLKSMKTKLEFHKIKNQQNFLSGQNLEEQITQLQANNNQQIFSIGVTILEICTLQQSKQIYTVKGINEAQIIKRLNQLEVKYSNDLIGIIWQMLKINPEHRIKTNDIYQILNIHQQDITHHRKFLLNAGFIKPSHNKHITLDIPLGSSSNTCDTEKKKKNSFSKFFPLLRSFYNTKEVVISEISQKACELQSKFRLASAN